MLRENANEAQALVGEGRRLKDDAVLRTQATTDATLFPQFRTFARYVSERERPPSTLATADVAANVFRLLEEHSLFSCQDEDDDDAPL